MWGDNIKMVPKRNIVLGCGLNLISVNWSQDAGNVLINLGAVTGFSKDLCSLGVDNIVINNITGAFYSTADGTRYSDRLV
jgi:hypothetical protein